MDPYRERKAAFDAYWERVRLFKGRPFPTDWAKVVNGVGLASFTMRVERQLSELSSLSNHDWKPSYLHRIGAAQSMTADLRALLETFDRFTPTLPPEPRAYFIDLRNLVTAAIAFTDEWWGVTAEGEPLRHA